jgi:programmed cell death protein 5
MSFQLPSGLRPAQPPSGGSSPSQGGGGPSQQDQGEAQERQRQQEEMKRGMIASMLTPPARERCMSALSHLRFSERREKRNGLMW